MQHRDIDSKSRIEKVGQKEIRSRILLKFTWEIPKQVFVMHFIIRSLQILTQTISWLYWFVASIASIKAGIAFLLSISGKI